jgi:hypothetical protein
MTRGREGFDAVTSAQDGPARDDRRNPSGSSGGGDHFWLTQFSAGNSNADNTQGYASGVDPASLCGF